MSASCCRGIDSGTPGAPPRWLAAVMRRFPRQNGESFEEYWLRTNLPAGAGTQAAAPAWRVPEARERRAALRIDAASDQPSDPIKVLSDPVQMPARPWA